MKFEDWSQEERYAAFCAGQEQLAREEAEYKARVAEDELRRAEAAQREAENTIYDMSGQSHTETPLQKLNRANLAMSMDFTVKEEPLTQAERGGLSEAQFLKLSPVVRLAFAHAATEARKSRP